MDYMDSINSLRKLLSKSPPKKKKIAQIMTPANQPAAFAPSPKSSPVSSPASPATPISVPHSPRPVLHYPSVDVPGSSPKSATSVPGSPTASKPSSPTGSPKSAAVSSSPFSPLKNFFKSYKGRSVWDADEDEFDKDRKYSIATLNKVETIVAQPVAVPHSEAMPDLAHSTGNLSGSSPDSTTDTTPAGSPLKRDFFKSYRGRSVWDVDEDEYDVRRPYSTATLKKDEAPVTPSIAASPRRSPSPYPLSPPKLADSGSSSSSKLKGRDFFKSYRGRSPFDADDNEFDPRRPYSTATLKSSPPSAMKTAGPSLRKSPGHARKVSWADQPPNGASSDPTQEQAKLGSKDDAESTNTGSTLSLTSTVTPNPPSPRLAPSPSPLQNSLLKNLNGYKTIRKSEGKLMSATLKAAREISPHKGSIWDPEDDEWMEMDAKKVVDTFKASYKAPMPRSPTKQGTLAYIQDAVNSALFSSSKKDAEQLQQEERIRDQIEELTNTFFSNPNGDLCDEVMKQTFLTRPAFFEYQESPRTMHVVDLEAFYKSDDPLMEHAGPRLCDAVATVLSHTNKECLEAFLNPTVKEFIYRREIDYNKGGLILIIRRLGNKVIVGAYVTFGFYYLWKLYVKSTVGITGQWHEAYATLKPGFMTVKDGVPEWDKINSDVPEPKVEVPEQAPSSPRRLQLSPKKIKSEVADAVNETNPKFMLFQSRVMAKYLLWDIWLKFENLWEVRASWEADGEVQKVRLKRALVGCEDEDEE